jgi:predicted alpha/beta hydrolase family esterase
MSSQEKMVKVIFIHGNGGGDINDPTGWFPYLKKEFEKMGLEVISQNFPDPIKAREKIWIPFIKKLGADENTILIGHSSGACAAMRYAENHKVLGTVLVSAAYTDLGLESEKVSGYFNHPWNWENIKRNQKWIIQFHSDDDPFIPVSEAWFISQKLNSDYHEFEDQGHFGHPTPKSKFPEIVKEVKKKLMNSV